MVGSLSPVRIVGFALALICATASFGQKLNGSYKGGGTAPVEWSINAHDTLIWGNTPYLPIGSVVDPSPDAIKAANANGINDVVVDLPAGSPGWKDAISTLEALHMRYLIRVSSLTPMAEGIAVDPASYRITDVSVTRHIDIPLPGASEALVVTAFKRDGTIVKYSKEPVNNGRLVCDVKQSGPDVVVLIYPTEISLEQPDFWEGTDTQRDRLLQTLKANPTGPGLRGFVNPLGKTLALPGRDLRFVPQSAAFRAEFASYLELKYRNVVGTLRSWAMPSGMISANETGDNKAALLTFDDLARFVPLWAGARGIPQVYDPKRGVLYGCESIHSSMWRDMADSISAAESRRYTRIVGSIREIDDVPVVQEWSGWAAPYEGDSPSIDGVGMRAKGSSPSVIAATAGKATSSCLRWYRPGWLPATDIDIDSGDATGKVSNIVDDLTSLGARGIFFRTATPGLIKEVSAQAKAHATDTSASLGSPLPIYFPENATNPAEVQRLAGGYWWLPAPFSGDRIDFGNGFYGYRMSSPKGGYSVTMWSDRSEKVLLRMANAKTFKASNLSGAAQDAKLTHDGVEITLTQNPIVISNANEIPVPEVAYMDTLNEILVLLADEHTHHRDLPEVTMALSDAKLSYERNPGGAFLTMRKLLHQLDSFLGRFTWSELETPADTNFSEVAETPGCSNNRTIDLHPLISSPAGYWATYDFQVKSAQDQEIWLSAKMNPEDRPYVSIDIAGQHLEIKDSPVGFYGDGYGWYHMGTTRNAVGMGRFKLNVNGLNPEFSADAVIFAPAGFQPNGLTCPEIHVDTTKKANPNKPKGRGSKNRSGIFDTSSSGN